MTICITNSTDHKYILYKIKFYKVALEYRQSFVQNFKFNVLRFHITRVYIGSFKEEFVNEDNNSEHKSRRFCFMRPLSERIG